MTSVYMADVLTVRRKGARPKVERIVELSDNEPDQFEKELRKSRFSVLALRLRRITKTERKFRDAKQGVSRLVTTVESRVVRDFKPREAKKWHLYDVYKPTRRPKK